VQKWYHNSAAVQVGSHENDREGYEIPLQGQKCKFSYQRRSQSKETCWRLCWSCSAKGMDINGVCDLRKVLKLCSSLLLLHFVFSISSSLFCRWEIVHHSIRSSIQDGLVLIKNLWSKGYWTEELPIRRQWRNFLIWWTCRWTIMVSFHLSLSWIPLYGNYTVHILCSWTNPEPFRV